MDGQTDRQTGGRTVHDDKMLSGIPIPEMRKKICQMSEVTENFNGIAEYVWEGFVGGRRYCLSGTLTNYK